MSYRSLAACAALFMLCACGFMLPAQAASHAPDSAIPFIIPVTDVEDEAVLEDLRPDDVPVKSEEESKPPAPEEREPKGSADMEQEELKESGPDAE